MERNLSQQTSDAKLAFQIQSQRLEEAKNNLILARVKRPLEESQIHKCETVIRTIESELEKLKGLNETLSAQKVSERKRQKNIEVYIHEQVAIVGKLKTESADLLKQLKSAQKINQRILQFSGQYLSMEKETGKKIDRAKTSSGFYSLQTIVEILESEVSGEGRRMFHWTNQFLI